jgi:Acyl-CoA dehydrogenase, middle domain
MSVADREIQAAARAFVDELLPHEVEAELHGGELPAEQLERWVLPTIRGERRECYAITEEGAGSDVDAIQATAHRDGDGYRLNGVKWHVTSFNHADHVFFQAKLADGSNPAPTRCSWSTWTPPASGWSARPPTATPFPTITRTAHGIDDGLDTKVQHAQCSMAKLYASEIQRAIVADQLAKRGVGRLIG